jgi:hypothetical protein
MAAIFPKWTARLPLILIVMGSLTATSVLAGLWYYFTPKYTRVGYQPIQPVAFPHSVHVDQMGLDCRYCHTSVEKSWYSNVPGANTCMKLLEREADSVGAGAQGAGLRVFQSQCACGARGVVCAVSR